MSTTAFRPVLLTIKDRLARLTLNCPETLNALSSEMLDQIGYALSEVDFKAKEQEIRVLLISGVDRAFAAGADIAEMQYFTPEEAAAFAKKGSDLFKRIERFSLPVIAQINGFCLGGGCELALACDIRIASEKAKFGQPEVALGLIPGFSGTQRLALTIGIPSAKELIYTGRVIKAEEAFRLGLVSRVVPHNELDTTVGALATEIALQSPNAVRLAKEAINGGFLTDLDSGIDIETELFSRCFASPEHDEGIEAFLSKRKPIF